MKGGTLPEVPEKSVMNTRKLTKAARKIRKMGENNCGEKWKMPKCRNSRESNNKYGKFMLHSRYKHCLDPMIFPYFFAGDLIL